jgi:hypothetical protein
MLLNVKQKRMLDCMIIYNLTLVHIHTHRLLRSISRFDDFVILFVLHLNSMFICSFSPFSILIFSSDNFEDNEDKNLSWLFNFKIDEIANLSPEIKRKRSNNNNNNNNNSNNHQHHQQTSIIQQNFSTQQHQQQQQIYDEPKSKDPCIEDDLNVAENVVIDAPSYSAPT